MPRGTRSSGRRRRPETQWVTVGYNGELQLVSGGGQDAQPLTWARNAQNINLFGGGTAIRLPQTTVRTMERSLAIRGWILLQPQESWTTATLMWISLRIVEAPMDALTGQMVVDAGYDLNQGSFASEPFLWEQKFYDRFALEPRSLVVPVNIKVGRKIDDNQALFLVAQNDGNADVNVSSYLRTLMLA